MMTREKEEQSSPADFLRTYWGPLSGVAGFISMMIVGNTTLHVVSTNQDQLVSEQRSLLRRLEEHEKLPAHPVSVLRFTEMDRRVDDNTRRLDDMVTRQRETDRDLRQQLDTINKNLTSLCVATHGATCIR